MDKDNSSRTKQILENGNDFQADFLYDLFESESSAAHYHVQAAAGYSENPVQYSKNHSEHVLNGNSLRIVEQNGHGLVNGDNALHKEFSSENENFKKKSKELLEQNNILQNQIIEYERKLSQEMQEGFSAKNERDSLKEKADCQEKELENARIQVDQLKAQIYQLTELKISQDETDNRVEELQKKLIQGAKMEQKLKKKIENDNLQFKKIKQNNKKLWNIIMRFGQKLAKVGNLTKKERALITEEYNEENPPFSEDFEFDDITEENGPLEVPTAEIGQQAGTKVSESNEQSQVVNESVSETSTLFLQPQTVWPSSSNNTDGFQSSKTPQCVSTLNRPHSFKHNSHYFRKTFQEILEDPHISDDCMDISGTELSTIKQQLGLDNGHFTPISPIPPTPSPRTKQHPASINPSKNAFVNHPIANEASNHSETSRDKQSQHSQIDSEQGIKFEPGFNRRLAFTHQQSEGFAVGGDSLNNVDGVNEDDSQSALPKFEQTKNSLKRSSSYRVCAERQNDGRLKLQFNWQVMCAEVDPYTNDITCTFPLPLNNDVLPEESSSNNVNQSQRPTPTPFSMPKPTLIKQEPIDDSPPFKKPKIAPDVEPFLLSTLSSKESGSSSFVSYKKPLAASKVKSERPFCNNAKEWSVGSNVEGKSSDFNLFQNNGPYGAGFQTCSPVAFTFNAKKPSNSDTLPDHSVLSKPVILEKIEENKCAPKSPSSIQLNELNTNILSEEHTSLQLQSKQVLAKERSLIEATTLTSPNSVINDFPKYKQQNVPVQSMDNIRSFSTSVNGTARIDSERTGYTSSESDLLEDSGPEFKSSTNSFGPGSYSNGSLRRRRKKLVSVKESSDAQFIRTKGRTRQSCAKKAMDKSSESDTNSKEKLLKSNSCTSPFQFIETLPEEPNLLQSNQVSPKKSNHVIEAAVRNVVEEDKKELEGLSKFKMPKPVSEIMKTKPDISVSLVSDACPMNGILTSPTATKISNGIPNYGKNIVKKNYTGNDCNKMEELNEPIAKETNENMNLKEHTNSNNNSDAVLDYLSIKKKVQNSNGVVLNKIKFSDQECNQINNNSKTKFMNIDDKTLVSPDVLHQGSIAIGQECVQKENTDELQNEGKFKNKKILKRRTRSTSQKQIERVANMSCTDTEHSESEQKSPVKSLGRKRKSKIDDLRSNKANKLFSPNAMPDSSNCKPEVLVELTSVTQSNVTVIKENCGSHSEIYHQPDVRFSGKEECDTNAIGNDDTDSPKQCLNSSKLSMNSVKTKITFSNSPKKNETQNFTEIDLKQMVGDSLYSLFDGVSKNPIPNIENNEETALKEEISQDLMMKQQTPNLNMQMKKYEKIPSTFAKKTTCPSPIPEKQPIITVQSMPLSPDCQDNAEKSFTSTPASPDAKVSVAALSTSNGVGTSSNTSHVDCKMDDALADLSVAEVEVETSPKVTRRTRSKSLLVENTTDVTSNSSKTGNINCCIIVDNDKISEIDSDNDSPLVIVEDNELHSDSVSEETSKMSVSPTSTNPPVRKSKRLKRKANSRATWKNQLSPSKKECSDLSKIEAAFQLVEKTKYTDANLKKAIHNLVSVSLDPMHSPDACTLIFLFVQHLYQTSRNPMVAYMMSEDVATLLPVTEHCIVSALIQIESKGKARFSNVLNSVILTLYNLVLGKGEIFSLLGLAALCRVLTQICKQRNSRTEPLKLCGELLQWDHRYAPYLIASVIGVWPEAFQLLDGSDEEENIFFGAIALGVKNRRENFQLTATQWKHCETIFSKFLPVPELIQKNIPKTVERLSQTIRSKCFESIYERDYLLTMPMVILCRVQGWKWVKEVVIETFIKPSLKKCTRPDELNEIGFEFLLNLYAEIYCCAPDGVNPHQLIKRYFQPGREDDDFVHLTAGICCFKLHLWRQMEFVEASEFLARWHNHERFQKIGNLIIRRSMSDRVLEKGDIIEYSSSVNSHQ